MTITTREYLRQATPTKAMVDRWLAPDFWADFDPEFGFMPRDAISRNGLDGSYAAYGSGPFGERAMANFAELPCRINTYGDSFTGCDGVSDGETWQEYLAAHLREPVRNFGVGGFGVYQFYRRMLREEATAASADNIVLNVWSHDHHRSIHPWGWLFLWGRHASMRDSSRGLHWPPWAYVCLNLETGEFEERDNPYPTQDSLYRLTDDDHVYEAFRDNFDLQAILAKHRVPDVNTSVLGMAAEAMGVPADFGSVEATARSARDLLRTCALRSSMYVLDQAKAYAHSKGKKMLVLLSYSPTDVTDACSGRPRVDQPFLDYLVEHDLPFVDSLQTHVAEFRTFGRPAEEYVGRYYLSHNHYNPMGNHFFAFAVKDAIVEWLDPKPPAYSDGEAAVLDSVGSRK